MPEVIPATPVPVTPPQVPPRPPLWVVIEPPLNMRHKRGLKVWDWTAFPDIYDNESDAQDYANENPGSVIFRLPGDGEKP